MDALSFFLLQHGRQHSADVAGGVHADRVFGEPTDDQMRMRPGPAFNSLVWLLWHMARTEDVAVNLVVTAGRQILDDAWMTRMNLPWRIIGTGMTDDEVGDVSARADIPAVRAYRSAVGLRTREVVSALRPNAWDEIVGMSATSRAAAAGAFRTGWVEAAGYAAWQGHSRATQLASSAIAHNALHFGEAITVRGHAGFGLGI